MATVEELLTEFQKLPDWQLYPLPEVMYQRFGIKKPQPGTSLSEMFLYRPPPSQSLNEGGKIEMRGPVEGGVREIKDLQTLPVEVKRTNEETGELEDYAPPAPVKTPDDLIKDYLDSIKVRSITRTYDDTLQYSLPKTWNHPTEDSTKDTQPSLDRSFVDLLRVFHGSADAAPHPPS